MLDDLRDAFRGLLRAPRFSAMAVLVLALGIGGSTAMFSAVNVLLLDSVPYPDAHRLLLVSDFGPDGSATPVAFGSFREIAGRNRTLESAAVARDWEPTLSALGEPMRVIGQRVSADYFGTLGVLPMIGPGLAAREDRPGGAPEVVLGHALWRTEFGAAASILGSEIEIDEQRYRVVGVMPEGFRDVLMPSAQLWGALQYDPALPTDGREWGKHLRMVGRLHAGATLESARVDIQAIGATPDPAFARPAHADLRHGALLQDLPSALTREIRPGLTAASAAVALLLLIACVNLANLLLVRGAQRSHEFSARTAMGASPLRLIRHQMLEVLLLALLGAAIGMVGAQLGLSWLAQLSEGHGAAAALSKPSGATLLFTLGVATAVGLIVGLVPALLAVRSQQRGGQQPGGQRGIGRHRAARGALVVVEVALATVLLVSAGLLLGSLQRLFAVETGMQTDQVLSMQIHARGQRYVDDAAIEEFYSRSLEAARAVPGVVSASFTNQLPMTADRNEFGTRFETLADEPEGTGYNALRYAVTPAYFETMGIPLRLGRGLAESDHPGAPKVAVISQSLAQRRFGDASPIGRRLRIGAPDTDWFTVVGVVGDVKQGSLVESLTDAVYIASVQWHYADAVRSLVVRTQLEPDSLTEPLRDAVWSVDASRVITRVASMDTLVARTAGERRLATTVFSAFGITALLLAALGLYGALSVNVAERTGEIGLRMALGARAASVARALLGQALGLIGIGLLLGLLLASGATRALSSLLYGLSANDPTTFLLAALTLGSVGLLACVAPLRRAVAIPPAQALRCE